MEEPEVYKLTRLANRLPGKNLKMERIDSEHGEIYFAYTESPEGIHGLWGHRNMARTIDFKPDTSIDDVRQVLVDDAAGFIGSLEERGFYG